MVVAVAPAPVAAPAVTAPPPPPRTMPNKACRIGVQILCCLLGVLQIDLWIFSEFQITAARVNAITTGAKTGAVSSVYAAYYHGYAAMVFCDFYIFWEIVASIYTLVTIHMEKPMLFIIGVGLRGFHILLNILAYSLVISLNMDTYLNEKVSNAQSISRDYMKMVTGFCFSLFFNIAVLLLLVYLFIMQKKAYPKTPAPVAAPAAVAVAPMAAAPMM